MFQLVFVLMGFFGMFHDPADRTLGPKRPVLVVSAPMPEEPPVPDAVVTYQGNGR